jgi:class 3 adenylate cyclase
MPFAQGRYIADHIPGAQLVELPGSDGPLFWEGTEQALDAIEGFVTGVSPAPPSDRVLATVLVTDIVGSTRHLERMGDNRWRATLDLHDDLAHRLLDTNGGRFVTSTGDGVLATLEGPGRAIRFATTFRDQLHPLGLAIRTGIHTGEVEMRGDDIGGVAVHLSARIMAEADPEEILVSRTVADLVAGSDLVFEDRGTRRLRGIDGEWRLLAVRAA